MFDDVRDGWGLGCTPPAQLLYLCLLQHRNKEGVAYPGNTRLLEMTCLSRSSLYRAFDELLELGWIAKEHPSSLKGRVFRVFTKSERESHIGTIKNATKAPPQTEPSHIGTPESHIGTVKSHIGTTPSQIGTHIYKDKNKGNQNGNGASATPETESAINCKEVDLMPTLDQALQQVSVKQAAEKKRKLGGASDVNALLAAIEIALQESFNQSMPKVTGKERGMVKHILTYMHSRERAIAVCTCAVENWDDLRMLAAKSDVTIKSKVPTIPLILSNLNLAAALCDSAKTPEASVTPKVSVSPPAQPSAGLVITTDDDEG